MLCFKILTVAAIWLLKTTSLPKLYFKISNKRGILVSTLRALEKQGKKLVKLRLDVKYFETCLDLDLYPEFLKLKITNLNFSKNRKDVYQTVVRNKLKEINQEKQTAEAEFTKQKQAIFSKLSFLEKICLISLLDQEFKKIATPQIKTHQKKLFNLWKKDSDKCPDCIFNLSEKKLTLHELNALKFGLNHPILPKTVQKDKIKTNIEKLLYSLKRNTDILIDDEIKDDIKFMVKRFVDNAKRACSNRANQSLHGTLRKLAQDSTIKICKLDKGNGIAILKTEDYYNKLDKIVNDTSKFMEVKLQDKAVHPLIQKENSISYYIKRYLKKVDGYARLIPSGSKPGKLYGLAKIHKNNVPLRPVVSMVDTPEYHLAKYLDNLIKPHIPDSYLLKSTDDFIQRLSKFPCNNSQTMVSFDVVPLFTNVPLSETIELIIEHLYPNKNAKLVPFNKTIFRKLMYMATQGLFMYKNKLYKQIDGCIMGSPLGPTLANFFLGYLETKLLSNNCDVTPKLYLRYIDDIYAVFNNPTLSEHFLKTLNTLHKNIKFTLEKATNANTLNFLDVQISLNSKGYETQVYRKPTNTGLLLNFNSICPTNWKSGLLMCLLHRAKNICSTYNLYLQEVKCLRNIFSSNNYPDWFLDKIIKKFQESNKQTDKYEKDFMFTIGIPFYGEASRTFAKRLCTYVKNKFHVDINVYYVCFKTGSYFQLKCCTPFTLMSNVVYKFSCSRDANISYIGMTTRHLGIRIEEHLKQKTVNSPIKEHINECDACRINKLQTDNFKIIRTCATEYETKIQETLLIKKTIRNLIRNYLQTVRLFF